MPSDRRPSLCRQAGYVAQGRFEVMIGDRTETLSAGDSFTPPRADFLKA